MCTAHSTTHSHIHESARAHRTQILDGIVSNGKFNSPHNSIRNIFHFHSCVSMACASVAAKHLLYTLHTAHNILDRRLAVTGGEIFSHKIRRRNQGEEQQQQQQPENRIKNATALNFRSARGKTQFRSHPKLEFLCLFYAWCFPIVLFHFPHRLVCVCASACVGIASALRYIQIQ